MPSRRDDLLDTAIRVVGESGVRGLTHRGVDVAAQLPAGSTSNYFRTRGALLGAVVDRFVERERENWDAIAAEVCPTTPEELAQVIVRFAVDSTGPQRTLTLARYAILGEAAIHPPLRTQLAAGGGRVNTWFTNWVRAAGSTDPERDTPVIMNHFTGIVLHQLAMPDPAFDPTRQITALVSSLIRPRNPEGTE
ncbi:MULTISPECIES: TetR/AcrR family transcriptional regulator [unclassified Parafrankia]|uniref:TetR/AcrR family transcriptional regulator n=1 Tax=Parafrankia TaxID=2994362 RepID=UPI000DA499EE|nr:MULTISPECIES: TetR/AcrR family transcriptional regulator [unclassified Parafrankia]TCJ32091.1 TetR/AcrR family transcriptional regulator [Parafrankia sp. BMG5.11]CAI7974132.1 TetR/AcrR family transcriptional regulator [Frankia sp. Hr75.2]SQE00173.1 TetR family transcriptional regulator [Parafrankia sp. Ea1.12]